MSKEEIQEYLKFKASVLEEVDCFTNNYQELKIVLEEVLDDIELKLKGK